MLRNRKTGNKRKTEFFALALPQSKTAETISDGFAYKDSKALRLRSRRAVSSLLQQ